MEEASTPSYNHQRISLTKNSTDPSTKIIA